MCIDEKHYYAKPIVCHCTQKMRELSILIFFLYKAAETVNL